uniref:Cyclin-like domain-containing protein n=2 Tax=Helicotheca tamesis TaxID=374047 RepID=A0A7S2HG49_9STRA|mmetsp:Transcript_17545/g.24182  ORF Transcript_17545/g.24182 Transcript_17545/m.24182 type:complete len:346 (+) Transcript_17545:166-1203(+)
MCSNVEQAVDRIIVMRTQEETVYKYTNYISSDGAQVGECQQEKEKQESPPHAPHMRLALEECIRFIDSLTIGLQDPAEEDHGIHLSSSSRDVMADLSTNKSCQTKKRRDSFPTRSTVHVEDRRTCEQLSTWRAQMCSWSYAVIDSYGFDRETVAIAFSILDRYVAMDEEPETITKADFQLMSMTALYTATKIMEVDKLLSTDSLLEMSQGSVLPQDVAEMELKILNALEWRLNSPTAMAFVREFLVLLPLSEERKQCMLSMTFHLTELAVVDSFFIPFSSSSIAAAALLVAASHDFEMVDGFTCTSFVANKLEKNIASCANLDINSEEIATIYDRLEQMYHSKIK